MEQFREVRQVKRKFSLLLCVLMVSLCFVGCSGKKQQEISAENESILKNTADFMVTLLNTEENEALLEEFENSSEFDLEYYCFVFKSQYGVSIQADELLSMIQSWEAAIGECGAYVTCAEYVVETTSDGYIVTTEAEYEDRNATIQFSYDEDCTLESLDISAKYQMNEILTKAGLNTLLGMGTVFAVLIFLAFLISLMKYIPKAMEWFKNSKAEKAFEGQDENDDEEVLEVVSVTDDLELVAVITAAIAAQSGTSSDGFVVRSIKRRPSNIW